MVIRRGIIFGEAWEFRKNAGNYFLLVLCSFGVVMARENFARWVVDFARELYVCGNALCEDSYMSAVAFFFLQLASRKLASRENQSTFSGTGVFSWRRQYEDGPS